MNNLICFIWEHDEAVHHGSLWCGRCGCLITEGYELAPDYPPSLEIAGHFRVLTYALRRRNLYQKCGAGHIAKIFGFHIGDHSNCDDIPF